MNACTIIAKNYLAHARELAKSFLEHHPEGTFTTLIIDDAKGYVDPDAEPFDVVTVADIGIEDFDQMATAYDVLELSTAVKPWLLRYLLNVRKLDSVVYLDPDIRIFHQMDELEPLMREHGLVLIPHATTPMPRDGKKPSEADILIAGVYNLGFIGLKSGPETDRLLDWWSERLRTDCKVAPARGYFVDQRWLDFVYGIASDFYVLKDHAYNVAYWNLHGRDLTYEDGRYYVDGGPLRFFHFSGFDPELRHLLSKHQTRIELDNDPALTRICDEYADALFEQGYDTVKTWPYTYGALPNGVKLDRIMRSLYPESSESGRLEESVFQPEGAEQFVAWLNEPAENVGRPEITRYLYGLYSSRPDLQRAFPNLKGPSGKKYVEWAVRTASKQLPIHERLLPPIPADQSEPVPSERPKEVYGVNVAGYLRSELGVGEAARQVISALDARSIPLAPIGLTTPSSRQGHNFTSFNTFDPPFPINLICVNADMLPTFSRDVGSRFFENRYSIGLWWWEVSEFPDLWKSSFDHVDEVWVGTQHVGDAISQISPVPVIRVTLPVSMPKVVPLSRATLGMPENFVFLFVFDYSSVFERKNPLALVDAFKSAFPPGSGASLVLKCINAERDSANHERLRAAADTHPDIHIIDRYVSVVEKNAMIASCDCYVSLHRSEGFGLTLAEAMYLQKPVVATAYSGNVDYMTPRNSYLVDYHLKPVGENVAPYPPTADWAEPDVAHAAELMRHIFENQDEARERGVRAAADIRRSHSPEVAGRAMAKRLNWIREQQRRKAIADRGADKTSTLKPGTVVKHVEAGPKVPSEGRLGSVGRFLRQTALRLIWPVLMHQQNIDKEILTIIKRTQEDLRETAQETAHGLETQSAIAQAEILAQLRKQDGRIEDLSGELATLRTKLRQQPEILDPKIAAVDRLVKEPGSPFELYKNPVWGLVRGYRQPETAGSNGAYGILEDFFQESEHSIRDRQRRYLDLLADGAPVLVAACGRGEFLDLLREHGIEYVGIDPDSGVVEHCRTKGHESVKLIDVNSYLEGCADGSLGAIFSTRLMEHLPHSEFSRFLALSSQKLKPDGLLIAESLNPNSAAAMKIFREDPTHQRPVFPEAALALFRISGFASAFVFFPNGSGDIETDRLRESTYALVATKVVQE